MSNETKNKLTRWYEITKEQTLKGNLVPLVVNILVGLWLFYEVIVPVYKDFKEFAQIALYGAAKSTEVSIDVEALKAELEQIKTSIAAQKLGRELGKEFELVIRE